MINKYASLVLLLTINRLQHGAVQTLPGLQKSNISAQHKHTQVLFNQSPMPEFRLVGSRWGRPPKTEPLGVDGEDFCRPDALPVAQITASKHCMEICSQHTRFISLKQTLCIA